jgi:hypothetical protein
MAKIKKAGRPKVAKKDKVMRIPISAKVRHHSAIKARFEEEIFEYGRILDKQEKP